MKNSKSIKKMVGGILGIVLVFVFYNLSVPAGYEEFFSQKSWLALGILVGAVVWMLFDFLPDYMATLAMTVAWAATGCVSFSTSFSTFSGTTWWLLFGALCIGAAASACGLLKRMALKMMLWFPATFKGQSLALVCSGIVISPLIPSTAAKSAIIGPLAKNISESMGYEPQSKQANGLFMSYYTGYVSAGMGFLSASFISYSLIALMPEGHEIAWFDWFLYALPWLVVAMVLMTLAILKMYKPKEDKKIDSTYLKNEYEKLGPLEGKERYTLIIMLVCLVLWMGEKWLNIPSAIVSVAAAVALIGGGILNRMEFRSKIAWDSMIFIGTFLQIPTVFSELGINKAVSIILGERLASLMTNPFLLIFTCTIVIYLIRFVVVSWTASAVLVLTILMPLCAMYGVHPWVVAFTCYCSTNTWNVIYQNTPYIAALVTTDYQMGTHQQLLPYSAVYMVCNTIACLACVPFWQLLGLM